MVRADQHIEGGILVRSGAEFPAAFGAEQGKLPRRGGIVGEDPNRAGGAELAGGAAEPQNRPGTEHAAGIDDPWRRAHVSNGLREARAWSRTGTAPKPSSLRIPLMR